MSRNKSLILLALAAIGFSIGGLFIKSVAWSPLAIAGTRSAIAAVVILLCIGKPRFTWSKPQLIGAFSYMATVICFVLATKLTNVDFPDFTVASNPFDVRTSSISFPTLSYLVNV